jgi:hypothetical protein
MIRISTFTLCWSIFTYLGVSQQVGPRVFTSSDSAVSIVIPADLDTMELNPASVLQVGNGTKEIYLIVINDSKEDLEGWNIQRHSLVTIGGLMRNVSSPQVDGPRNLAINGLPAIQYTIQGSTNSQNIVYVITTVETPQVLSQILTWSLRSQYDKNKSVMDDMIKSFKAVRAQ